jgi:hypothetical protein
MTTTHVSSGPQVPCGAGHREPPVRVAVVGTYLDAVPREESRSLEEMIYQATAGALRSVGLPRDQVDSVVLSGYDQSDGRIISCMVTAGPAAGVGKDTTMIASSGDHALIYGYLRLLARQSKTVMIVGWGKPSESVSPERSELVSAEPFLLRDTGVNNSIAAALQASRLRAAAPLSGTVCWPLGRADLPRQADAVYVIVLAADGTFTPGAELGWIAGAGWATGSYDLGARDLGDVSLLDDAVGQMVRQGGPGVADWGAVEVAAPSEPMVAAAVRHLGLAGSVRVNGSGGLADRPAPPHAAGLARMVAAVEALQSSPAPCTAGIAMQGFAAQSVSVMAFRKSGAGS